ncbi:NAD(P)H-hydrate dehydratase [Geobacter pelophilus]|uniref:Bifunctional NAD(P)H-hydrate repair enzyme n=1 Tax=Geoanaerobacter pelophilus TaxID=60036 RepID=A0AAW4KWW5_9BACT|nr:NAD(P)H-hydrate dehydratase [Geoanaerobacter pelophilus]MBT0662804.1 NAD(P)H-hydrate dehydratase [Geoanaerobacter pelophilus]
MKVITSEEMQKIDHAAINNYGVPGIHLMERAGEACADAIRSRFSTATRKSVLIFAGKGNNGGDGYVIASKLHAFGWDVSLVILAHRSDISGDAEISLSRLPNSVMLKCCCDNESLAAFSDLGQYALVVDAIFGTGLKSEISGVYRQAIKLINSSGLPVIAVDIPSGVDGNTGAILGVAIRADLTITFAAAKLGHVLYPGAVCTGELMIADIGIPSEVVQRAHGYEFVDAGSATALLMPRLPVSHKGSFGHVLIVAGSTGHTGAAVLAGASAVRSGAGLVTLAVPSSLNQIFEIKTTEAMTLPIEDAGRGYLRRESLAHILAGLAGKNVVALGPGLSRQPETALLVQALLTAVSLPLVVDADGLNAISENVSVLGKRAASVVVLTPHPGEMARLTGLSIAEIEADRIGVSTKFAQLHKVYLILKGARTIIASPDGEVAINGSGNPGMASGGMGDVLTGIVASLIGQGYPPFNACRLAVFIHGYAADLVAQEKGEVGLIASDVVAKLPVALQRLLRDCKSRAGLDLQNYGKQSPRLS